MSLRPFSITYEGFVLSGKYEYEPGFKGDWIDPPYSPSVNIYELLIDGKPGADLLNPAVEQWAIERILETHHAV